MGNYATVPLKTLSVRNKLDTEISNVKVCCINGTKTAGSDGILGPVQTGYTYGAPWHWYTIDIHKRENTLDETYQEKEFGTIAAGKSKSVPGFEVDPNYRCYWDVTFRQNGVIYKFIKNNAMANVWTMDKNGEVEITILLQPDGWIRACFLMPSGSAYFYFQECKQKIQFVTMSGAADLDNDSKQTEEGTVQVAEETDVKVVDVIGSWKLIHSHPGGYEKSSEYVINNKHSWTDSNENQNEVGIAAAIPIKMIELSPSFKTKTTLTKVAEFQAIKTAKEKVEFDKACYIYQETITIKASTGTLIIPTINVVTMLEAGKKPTDDKFAYYKPGNHKVYI